MVQCWKLMPATPELKWLRQEDFYKFDVSRGYRVNYTSLHTKYLYR